MHRIGKIGATRAVPASNEWTGIRGSSVVRASKDRL